MDAESLPVPNSTGTAGPRAVLPRGACDAHTHIYDDRFPVERPAFHRPQQGTAADYRRLQARLGCERVVVVTPTVYATDNRVTLDAIQALGADRARGVAVLHPEVSDAELQALHAGGIRGIRFTLFEPATAVTSFDMVEPLAHRIQPLGWHVQLHWRAEQIVEHAALLARLPCPMVFDHLARLGQPDGLAHPAFGIVERLLREGRAWVKWSAPYLDGRDSSGGIAAVTAAFLAAAPDRMVWGSDWPHPTERSAKPDDAALLDLFAQCVPDAALRHRILVDNPARLYGFG